MKLKDIKLDNELAEMRGIDEHTVNRYVQNMTRGDSFPEIVLDQNNNVISGHHRYYAYLKVFGENHDVEIVHRDYDSQIERIEDFVKENVTHGMPITSFSQQKIVLALRKLGASNRQISSTMSISEIKVEKIAGYIVNVTNPITNESEEKPLKKNLRHLSGKTLTPEQYADHENKDRGIPITSICDQIIRHLDNDLADREDERLIGVLERLRSSVDSYLSDADS